MKYCVVGGSGFIGSHLVDSLKKEHDVVNVDIKLGREYDVRDLRFFDIDCFKALYHLAASPWSKIKSRETWFEESRYDFLVNVYGTFNVLKQFDYELFVFTSTANLYGNGRKFTEESQFNIFTPYGYSKAIAERIVSESGRPYVIYRFGTVVGERGRTFPNRLVWCAVNGEEVEVFNKGDTYRDLVDVRDIVSALKFSKELPDGIYNVSSGMEVSGRELVEIVAKMAEDRGHEFKFKYVNWSAPGHVPYSTLNIDKIQSWGWNPQHTLEDMINPLFDYYEGKDSIVPPRWNET